MIKTKRVKSGRPIELHGKLVGSNPFNKTPPTTKESIARIKLQKKKGL